MHISAFSVSWIMSSTITCTSRKLKFNLSSLSMFLTCLACPRESLVAERGCVQWRIQGGASGGQAPPMVRPPLTESSRDHAYVHVLALICSNERSTRPNYNPSRISLDGPSPKATIARTYTIDRLMACICAVSQDPIYYRSTLLFPSAQPHSGCRRRRRRRTQVTRPHASLSLQISKAAQFPRLSFSINSTSQRLRAAALALTIPRPIGLRYLLFDTSVTTC